MRRGTGATGRRTRRTSKRAENRVREKRKGRRRNWRKMREGRKAREKVSGVHRIGPEVEFKQRRGAGGTGEYMADGVRISRTFRTQIVVHLLNKVLIRTQSAAKSGPHLI